MRKYSNYFLYTVTRINHANLHNFTVYIPPDWKAQDRQVIYNELLWAIDTQIERAKGINHYIITGDFNKAGIREMQIIAQERGMTKIDCITRGDNELDAIFVSRDILIKQQETHNIQNLLG